MSDQHIFISYAHQDEAYVRVLAGRMREAGLEPWYYVESQRAGIDFTERLCATIEQARAVVLVLTQSSATSEFVLQEVLYAKKYDKHIIPVSLEQCDGPVVFHVSARNWIRCWDGSNPMSRILDALTEGALLLATDGMASSAWLTSLPEYAASLNRPTYILEALTTTAPIELPSTRILCSIGREAHNDLVCSEEYVSKKHARISVQVNSSEATFVLRDVGSRHGTFVNGTRIRESHRLADGDRIGLGTRKAMLQFTQIGDTGPSPDTRTFYPEGD